MERDFNCLKFSLEKKDNQISQYNKILEVIKIEYRKLFNEKKSLIEKNKKIKQQEQQQQQQPLLQQQQQQQQKGIFFIETKFEFQSRN